MGLAGVISTGHETASRKPDIYELTLLEKSAARFLRLLTKLRNDIRKLKSPVYKTQERRPRGQQTRINLGAGYLSTDLQVVVDDSSIFSEGDLALITRSQEMVRITAITRSTHTLTITRGVGSTAAAINDNDYVLRISRVENEAYTIGPSYVTDTTQVTNYASTISTPVEHSNLQALEHSYLAGGVDNKTSRVKADEFAMSIEHLREIDRQLMFSFKSVTLDANNRSLYTTGGMIPSITTNIYNHSGSAQLTEAQYNTYVAAPSWGNDSVEKWQLSSNKALSVMESFQRNNVNYDPGQDQTIGFSVSKYKTTRGVINVVHYPHLDATPYYEEGAVVIDFNHVRLALLQDTTYDRGPANNGLQVPNQRTKLNEWSTICGLDIQYEEAHLWSYDWVTAT